MTNTAFINEHNQLPLKKPVGYNELHVGKMLLDIIDPIQYPNWDRLVLTNKGHSFFHSSSWAKVLQQSYKFRPLYFTAIKDNKLSALIPIMEINSFLTGKRGVSLPFSDFCQPISANQKDFQQIIKQIVKYGQREHWKTIEWRGGKGSFLESKPSKSYYLHTLDLITDENKLLNSFRGSTRRNIAKAVTKGITTQILTSFGSVREFYRLNCMTRKRHGLPPQPYYFFKKIYEHIISKNLGFVVLASYQEKNVAGIICFHSGKKAIYKYGASDIRYLHHRPNNLIMWEAIKWYIHNGFKTFSFGITEPNNKGLLQFKRGWGVTEDIIYYYKYNLTKAAFVEDFFQQNLSSIFLKKIPSPLLKLLGIMLYRHVA